MEASARRMGSRTAAQPTATMTRGSARTATLRVSACRTPPQTRRAEDRGRSVAVRRQQCRYGVRQLEGLRCTLFTSYEPKGLVRPQFVVGEHFGKRAFTLGCVTFTAWSGELIGNADGHSGAGPWMAVQADCSTVGFDDGFTDG